MSNGNFRVAMQRLHHGPLSEWPSPPRDRVDLGPARAEARAWVGATFDQDLSTIRVGR
jgi:hypothetical protein